jgi:lipid II:glycine glycyltransferase (peptidoglycan interpeptide bridge formation enzyme)
MKISYDSSRRNLPDFIRNSLDSSNVFCTEIYSNHLNKNNGTVFYFYSNDFVLPIEIRKRYFFKWANILSETIKLQNGNETESEFLDAVVDLLSKIGVDWLNQTPTRAFFNFAPKNCLYAPFGNHVVNLNLSEDELWTNMTTKCRTSIRSAIKHEVEVLINDRKFFKDFSVIVKETWLRSKMNVDNIDFHFQALNELGENAALFLAQKDGELQSGCIVYFNKKMCYAINAGTKTKPINGVTNMLYWEIFKYMKSIGVEKFNFVGARININKDSKYYHIQSFKESFGSELVFGFLFKKTFNPFKKFLFNCILFLKTRNLPQPDLIDQERIRLNIQD